MSYIRQIGKRQDFFVWQWLVLTAKEIQTSCSVGSLRRKTYDFIAGLLLYCVSQRIPSKTMSPRCDDYVQFGDDLDDDNDVTPTDTIEDPPTKFKHP